MQGINKTIIPFFLITILLIGCQKKDGDYWVVNNSPSPTPIPTPTPVASKLRAYVEETNIPGAATKDSFNLIYDTNNRLSTAISAISPLNFSFNYNFSNGYAMELLTGGGGFTKDRVLINSNSLINTSWQYNENNDTTTFKWLYNSSNKLIEERNYEYTTTAGALFNGKLTYTYNALGNVSEIADFDATGTKVSTEIYTYTTLNGNSFSPLISNFHPILSTKLPASKTLLDNTTGLTITINYTHQFDGLNRLIKEIGTITGLGTIVKKFYYQ